MGLTDGTGLTAKELYTTRRQLEITHGTEVGLQERVARMNQGQLTQADIDFMKNALDSPTVDQFLSVI